MTGSAPSTCRVFFPAKYRRLGAKAGPNLQNEKVPVVLSIQVVGVEIDEALEFLPGLAKVEAVAASRAKQDAHLLRATGAPWPALLASREAWEQSVANGATVWLTPEAWPAARKQLDKLQATFLRVALGLEARGHASPASGNFGS